MIDRYHLLLGTVALGIGVILAVVDSRGPLVFRLRVPGLVLSAASLLTVWAGVARWFPWMLVAAVAVAPADPGRPPHPLGRWTWPLALVSLVGVWSAVPDTEPALAAAACLAPVAVLRWSRDESPGPVGTAMLVALVMGAAWVGAAEQVAPLCTAVAVGAILVAPVLLGYRRSLRGAGLAVTSVAHCVLAIAGSRAIMAMAPADAAAGAVVVLALDAAAVMAGAALSGPVAASNDDG